MIHELLLGISGHPSPLLSSSTSELEDSTGLQSILSPAERALLKSLAQGLGERNRNIRTNASAISSSHPSTICRAVSTAIVSTHLAAFQHKILEVEKNILEQDARIVGAYNIVPLSAVAEAFDGWTRKLEWLWDLVQFIQAQGSSRTAQARPSTRDFCTAAELLKHLEESIHTGYPDIERISLNLLKVAETAWLKQTSTWVLYGRHPASGAADFFIKHLEIVHNGQSPASYQYDIEDELVPHYVTKATAQSILSIGKALNYIRDRKNTFTDTASRAIAPDLALLPSHLSHLSSHLSALESPLTASSFSAAIGAIRLSLSQNALQKLLPIASIMQMLHLLKDFFLMDNGEFAIALITAADERLPSRNKADVSRHNLTNDLASMTIKEGEVSAVLARAWNALDMLQSLDPTCDEVVDEYLDRARSLIRLSIKSLDVNSTPSRGLTDKSPVASFDDLLLPSSTVLSLRVHPPMDLFLAPADVEVYSSIHAYLLAIRRAHLRLSKLFLLSALRRDQPSSKALVSSNHKEAFESLANRRRTANQRAKTMRPVWAQVGSAAFFLAELGEYFQGEVVKGSWSTFQSWLLLNPVSDVRSADASLISSTSSGRRSYQSRPMSSGSSQGASPLSPRDPETLTKAHRRYLASLEKGLLLDDFNFTALLRRFLTSIDHLVALTQRLHYIQQTLDLETNAGVSAAARNFAAEAQGLMQDLGSSCQKVSSGAQSLIEALRAIDAARTGARSTHVKDFAKDHDEFIPWANGGVERLLLKFDSGNVEKLLLQQSGDS
ncbi:hypothetical protein JMJ35_005563 [Cladonia borealis]|uniref:Spindle pole body component n=1 Tax=Cladonia borealis TaxID=184061 RepID=A0AA39R291_9LECA|nr:hypothetical protein JMJ35_005563 [Cladonia borealis]